MNKIYYNRRKFVKLSTAAAVGGAAVLSGIGLPREASAQNQTNNRPHKAWICRYRGQRILSS